MAVDYIPVLKAVIEHLYSAGMPKTWKEQRRSAADIYQKQGYSSPFPLDLVTARKRLMCALRTEQIPNWIKEDDSDLMTKYKVVMQNSKNCYRGIVVPKTEEDDDSEYSGGCQQNNTDEQPSQEQATESEEPVSEEFDFDNPPVLKKKRVILKPKRFVLEGDTPTGPPVVVRRTEIPIIKQEHVEEEMPVADEEQPVQEPLQRSPSSQEEIPLLEAESRDDLSDENSEEPDSEGNPEEEERIQLSFEEQEESLVNAADEIAELRHQLEVSENIIDGFRIECHEKMLENQWLKVHKGFDPTRLEDNDDTIRAILEELQEEEEKNLAELDSLKIHFDYLVEQSTALDATINAQNQIISGQIITISLLQNEIMAGHGENNRDAEAPLSRNNVNRRVSLPISPLDNHSVATRFAVSSALADMAQGALERPPSTLSHVQNSEVSQIHLPNRLQTKPVIFQVSPKISTDDQYVPVSSSYSVTSVDNSGQFHPPV